MMKKKMKGRKWLKWTGICLATPVLLFLVLAVLIYLPPVQDLLVRKVAAELSASTGMKVSVGRIRLAFPLDLAVHRLCMADRGDTLLAAESLRLNVRLVPLLQGRADIDGFSLYGAQVDSRDWVSDTYVRGRVGYLEVKSHGVEWGRGRVVVDEATLRGADLCVALSDTARKDTSATSSPWLIEARRVVIEDTRARLSLPGDSMRLAAGLGYAELLDGRFDTGRPDYAVERLTVRRSALTYAVRGGVKPRCGGNEAFAHTDSLLWSGFRAASPGLDFNYIDLTDVSLRVDTLHYDSAGTLRGGLARLALRDRSGVEVRNLSGPVFLDTARLVLRGLNLELPHSALRADAALDWKALQPGGGGQMLVRLEAGLAPQDVRMLGRGMVDDALLGAWPERDLKLRATVAGNVDRLSVNGLEADLRGALRLTGSADGRRLLADNRLVQARFRLDGRDMDFVQDFLPEESRGSFSLPCPLTLAGTAALDGPQARTDLTLSAAGGRLAVKGQMDLVRNAYRAEVRAARFPVGRFAPVIALGPFSGSLRAEGCGFDPFAASTRLVAEAAVDSLSYGGWGVGNVALRARLDQGHLEAQLKSDNDFLEGDMRITGNVGQQLDARLTAAVMSVNLHRMGLVDDTLAVGGDVDIALRAARDFSAYGAEGGVSHLRFETSQRSLMAKDLDFQLNADADTTWLQATAGDLQLAVGTSGTVDQLLAQTDRFMETMRQQAADKRIDQQELKGVVPRLDFKLDAGRDNPLGRMLQTQGITYSHLSMRLKTDPRWGVGGLMRFGTFERGGLMLDTVHVLLYQDSLGLKLNGYIHNYRKDNPHKFNARLTSFFLGTGLGAQLVYTDQAGRKGIDVGVRADLAPGGINLSVFPEQPVIAYRTFTVNDSNFIYLGRDRSIRANVSLLADDGTGLHIFGEPVDSANDLTVSLNQVNLGELSEVLPYLPRLGGMLSGDLHVTADRESLSAAAMFTAENLSYEDVPLGKIGLEAMYMPQKGGAHYATAYVTAEDEQVMECEGVYVDRGEGSFDGKVRLTGFPLPLVNGFLAGTDIALKGTVRGELDVKGSAAAPVLDGTLAFDTAHLYSDAYGFDFQLDEQPIEMKAGRLTFENYGLYSAQQPDNPLVMNGAVDMSDFSRIGLDLSMRATNFEIINTKRKASSLLFGKVYADYSGTLRGTMDNIFIRGNVSVLDRTDMTYILKDSPLTVDDRLSDLVQFVSFADTTAVYDAPTVPTGGFDMSLGISISDAARFRCNLSEDGENYVNLEGGGDLTMRITQQGDLRLTGSFTANSGEMKYSLPVIPLKTFTIVPGSSVSFTGDVMNPTLNIAAKERVKATVTENDQPRSVAFDVGVALSRPLNDMGLEFTIEAPEDLSVQNQLAAMTTAQRSKAAVAMLATGMYMTDDLSNMSGSGFKASNALNAFLQSEIQNIAGSALKTIDVTVGMESGTSSKGTETTDYSFQFAKRFWNNRISVIIGGKVSTGEDAQNSAASFIDNIAVEYRLDKSASRYVRVFYDRSTQDPLEGELTTTGAGLVLRRKTNRLGELFIFSNRKGKKETEEKDEK